MGHARDGGSRHIPNDDFVEDDHRARAYGQHRAVGRKGDRADRQAPVRGLRGARPRHAGGGTPAGRGAGRLAVGIGLKRLAAATAAVTVGSDIFSGGGQARLQCRVGRIFQSTSPVCVCISYPPADPHLEPPIATGRNDQRCGRMNSNGRYGPIVRCPHTGQ